MRAIALSLFTIALLVLHSGVTRADPGDPPTESQVRNSQLGPYNLTPAEQRLAGLRRAATERFIAGLTEQDAREKARNRSIGAQYTLYEEVSVPTYEQETPYWCAPATVKMVLASPRINRIWAQSTLAGEMGTTQEGTYVGATANALNNHTIYDGSVAPNMPANWIWLAEAPGGVTPFVNWHREDLWENLPSVFNPRGRNPNTGAYLVGWTSDGGHYVAGGGYREDDTALISEVKYVDPYQNPSTNASLGPHWMDSGTLWQFIATNTGLIVH